MNIHGYKSKLEKAKEMLKKENRKGRKDYARVKIIEIGMNNLRRKINKLKKIKKK